jgi:hypothetical protein
MEALKSDQHEVIKMNLFQVQVCSLGTEEEALDWVRGASPAGTSNNWQRIEEAAFRPAGCSNGKGRVHYMFNC